jgi:DNA-binding GntR family transcriptional regulator
MYNYSENGADNNKPAKALETIKQAILNGDLRPNERLVESQLAKKFGMSRTPVREALKQLEMQGYLSRLANGGLVVTDHSPGQVRNLYEVREALETAAICLACQRATREQLDRAEEHHKRFIEVIQDRDLNRYIELDSAFHNALLEACGNEQLWSLIQTFRDQYFDRRLVKAYSSAEWRTTIKHHERLLEAVRQKNTRLAEKAVHDSFKRSLRIALERL